VLPQSLCTSFAESLSYPLLVMMYNDGTLERSVIQDGVNAPRALRTWTMAKRLNSGQLATLYNFFDVTVQGGLRPFYFYNPFDVLPNHHMGSNYDSSGASTQGRVTCIFRGDWSQRTELGRHVMPGLMLVEVA